MPTTLEWALNIAVLAGTVLGQLGFAILADVYGRQRMYGLELLIIIISVIGVTMASNGSSNSMSLVGWLVAWRFLLGIGIGGDYPLSAVITSEFAPTKHRTRMLASVFFMQPCGYLVATVVSMIALVGYRDDITTDSLTCMKVPHCQRALDRVWRWLVGLGAVPALVAIVLRFTIPESPRYTMEVLNRPDEALQDVREMELPRATSLPRSINPNLNGDANAHDLELQQRLPPPASGDPSGHLPEGTLSRHASFRSAAPLSTVIRSDTLGSLSNLHPNTPRIRSMGLDGKPPSAWAIYRSGLKEYFITKGYWLTLAGTSLTWASFDFAFYVLGPISYEVVAKTFNEDESNVSEQDETVYLDLLENSWHSLVIVSIGSMIGGLAMIYLVQPFSSRKIQMVGFLVLTVLFVTIGLCFEFLNHNSSVPLMAFLYILAQIFFEIGPNFTTYIIPAELFPTRYRCTGHGVSAAAGKVAAVLVQVFVSFTAIGPYKVSDNGVQWFGYVIIIFAGFMILGAVATKWWIPEIRNPDGSNRPLEELDYIGKVFRRKPRCPPRPLSVSAAEADNISSTNGAAAPPAGQ